MTLEHLEPLEQLSETKEKLSDGVLREVFIPLEQKELAKGLEQSEAIVGTPEKDMEHWHLQDNEVSCAVVCQEFVAEALLGDEYSESRMIECAEKRGLFHEKGTFPEDVGKLLEDMGLEVTREYGCTEADLQAVLEQGGKAIVGISSLVLEYPSFFWRPGLGANHAVEVIGLDKSNPRKVQVILNDPGRSNGAGYQVALKDFKKAWSKGGCFMASVFR